jgi:hypothetical protein
VHIEKFPHNSFLSAAKKLSCLHWSHGFMILLLLMLGLMVDTCSIRCCVVQVTWTTQLQSIIHSTDFIWEDWWSDRWSHKSFAKCHLDLGNHFWPIPSFLCSEVLEKESLLPTLGEKSIENPQQQECMSPSCPKRDLTSQLNYVTRCLQ